MLVVPPGETRSQRLLEFVVANPGVPVIGLREGSALRVEDGGVMLLGDKPAILFGSEHAPREVPPGPVEV